MTIVYEEYLRGKNDRKAAIVKAESFVERLIELQKNLGWGGPMKVI